MILYYLRHGDPIYDPNTLTPLGKRQAEALSHRLALFGLDEIFVSSSERARMTAQPTCELLKKQMTVLPWADEDLAWDQLAPEEAGRDREWCFFRPDYLSVFASSEMKRLGDEWYTHPIFENTAIPAGVNRINGEADRWLRSLGFEHDREKGAYRCLTKGGRRIALFAHEGFGLTFLSSILDIPFPSFTSRFDMSHSCMTVISFPENEEWCVPRMLQLSNDAHLYAEHLPLCYKNGIRL